MMRAFIDVTANSFVLIPSITDVTPSKCFVFHSIQHEVILLSLKDFLFVIKFRSVELCQYAYVMMKYFGKEVLSGCKTKA